MGIRSEPFRGVVLSGDDIGRFEEQVKNQVPTKEAVETVRRGVALATEFRANGFVTYTQKRRAG